MNSTKLLFLSFFGFLLIVSNIYSQTDRFDELLQNHNNRLIYSKHIDLMDVFPNIEKSENQIFRNMQKQDFDSSSVVDSVITKDPNGDKSGRRVFTYDSNGNRISALEEHWDISQWVNYRRGTYTYNSNENFIFIEIWDGSQWVNHLLSTLTYDLNGNIITELVEIWDGSQWENNSRHTFIYDSSGNQTSFLSESWNISQWVNYRRDTYTCDPNGNRISALMEIWDGSQWVNYLLQTFTYDSNGNRISALEEHWDGSQWVNFQRGTYTYNSNGNLISAFTEQWDTTQWVNYRLNTYTYDSNENFISKLTEIWDGSQWSNGGLWTYTWDSNGNMTFGKYEEWVNGNWIAAEGSFFFYDSFGRPYIFYNSAIYVYYSIITNVSESDIVINKYSLSQNYPNPFNPVTNISYTLPKASKVKLEIYNLLGQQITMVINEYKPAGYHEVQLEATQLSSGIYMYRIQAGEFSQVKKMVVMK